MAATGRFRMKEGNCGGSIDTEPRMEESLSWARLSLARTRDRDRGRDHA